MKLLAVRLARSIWLIPQYFLNPKGVYIRPVIEALKARYSFLKTPLDNPASTASQEYKFEQGAFNGKNGPVQILSVAFHADGIVVDTRSSTDDGDAFLEDALSWVSKEYGLPSYTDLPIKRIYVSELNVILEKPARFFNQKLTQFFDEVSSTIGDETTGKVDFMSFQVSTDQTKSAKPAIFRVDREINTPFHENRYYSFAPTKTDSHLKLLQKLEDAI